MIRTYNMLVVVMIIPCQHNTFPSQSLYAMYLVGYAITECPRQSKGPKFWNYPGLKSPRVGMSLCTQTFQMIRVLCTNEGNYSLVKNDVNLGVTRSFV